MENNKLWERGHRSPAGMSSQSYMTMGWGMKRLTTGIASKVGLRTVKAKGKRLLHSFPKEKSSTLPK